MQFAVEAWAPEYGAAVEDAAALAPSDAPVDVTVEVEEASWAPRPAVGDGARAPIVIFIDGVRRIDARVWVSDGSGQSRQGICASYAAGAVRCDGSARVVEAEVRRGLFCPGHDVDAITTRHGRYPAHAVAGDGPEQLSLALQQQMGALEVAVAQAAVANEPVGDVLVVVDGPLRQHQHLAGALGYVKSQHLSYGPAVVASTVAKLGAGERTPVFVVGDRWQRYSWYLRLPGERTHAWSSIVRCEATTTLSAPAVVALADRVSATLPRFASVPQKDPRAPQNLFPIAGLERDLRHRLGDPALLFRSLRLASAA